MKTGKGITIKSNVDTLFFLFEIRVSFYYFKKIYPRVIQTLFTPSLGFSFLYPSFIGPSIHSSIRLGRTEFINFSWNSSPLVFL